MLHTKFRGNRPSGCCKKIFEGIFAIQGHGGHIGHVTSIISTYFHFLVPKRLHTRFGGKGPIGVRKRMF